MIKKYWKKFVDFLKGKIEDKLGDYDKGDSDDKPEVPNVPETPTTPTDPTVPNTDDVSFSLLHWDKGGVNGSKATLVPSAKIGNLALNNEGMRYRWISGGCENFGASGAGDFSKTLACIFYKDSSGSWTGGKFDWISTNRTTRDFKNVHGKYNNWDGAAFDNAKEFCFCIASSDWRKRTNVIGYNR